MPSKPAYDTPWKIALEHHFQHFMAFYFPLAYAEIDWRIKHEFLDKELQAITKKALVGTKHVDKLVKVQLLSGQEDWICIHVEVQVAKEKKFAERMFTYNYRIFDRYKKPCASMAVLGDNDANWVPQQFVYAKLGCKMDFSFPIAKLISFAKQEAELTTHSNPFALLTLAYLQTRATRRDMATRFEVKCKLVRLLYARKWEASMIREFFSVIDWMMALPPQLEMQLDNFVTVLEKEQEMEYITSIERVRSARQRQEGLQEGLQKGLQEGKQEGLQEGESTMLKRLLTRRFGNLPPSVQVQVSRASSAQIEAWFDRAVDALTLEDVFQDLPH